jgi:hypothetical protein
MSEKLSRVVEHIARLVQPNFVALTLRFSAVFVPSPHELAAQNPNSLLHFTRQVYGERVRERGRTTLGSPPLPNPLPHKHRGNASQIEEF